MSYTMCIHNLIKTIRKSVCSSALNFAVTGDFRNSKRVGLLAT